MRVNEMLKLEAIVKHVLETNNKSLLDDLFEDWSLREVMFRIAVKYGKSDTVKLLLSLGYDCNGHDDTLSVPLHLAASRGDAEIIKLLLDQGACIWATNSLGNTPIDLDATGFIGEHRDRWTVVLESVKKEDTKDIKTITDIHHVASVMQPHNLLDIPDPKEFVRTLFLQYIPHKPEFGVLYEAIFAAPRSPAFDLQAARKEAAKGKVGL